jgi:copper chaperone CopZ
VPTVVFEVEQAGCGSCASRVRGALEPLGTVGEIGIDEQADSATVTLTPNGQIGEDEVNGVLLDVSHGSGHAYRVRPGSWRSTDSR